MVDKDKVCRNCRYFTKVDKCPICGESNFSKTWKGVLIVNDPNGSEIAGVIDAKTKGRYCLWVK